VSSSDGTYLAESYLDGTYLVDDDSADGCVECPAGRYNAEYGTDECDLCEAGYATENVTGATNSSFCKVCPAGKYGYGIQEDFSPGREWCKKCAAGRYSAVRRSSPYNEIHFFSRFVNSKRRKFTPSLLRSLRDGMEPPTTLTTHGVTSAVSVLEISNITTTHTDTDGEARWCEPCLAGTESSAGNTTCSMCPKGEYSVTSRTHAHTHK
jgi:hypothetical protein